MAKRKSMMDTMAPQQRQMAEAFLRAGQAPPPSEPPLSTVPGGPATTSSTVVRMGNGSHRLQEDLSPPPPTDEQYGLVSVDRVDHPPHEIESRPTPRLLQTMMPQRTFVSRTYRLAPHLVGTLNAAASEKAQQRTSPYTREDILHEALSDWFKKQGYMAA